MFKFIIRFLKLLSSFIFIEIPLQLAGAILLLPLCAIYDIGKLPRIFRYFDSADPFVGRDTSVIDSVSQLGWWAKYSWLAWRNPINYFEYTVLGFQFSAHFFAILTDSPPETSHDGIRIAEVGTSTGSVPGFFQAEIQLDKDIYYEYYWVYKYQLSVLKGKCFRFRIGHKIGHPRQNRQGSWCQHVLTINPFATYYGI